MKNKKVIVIQIFSAYVRDLQNELKKILRDKSLDNHEIHLLCVLTYNMNTALKNQELECMNEEIEVWAYMCMAWGNILDTKEMQLLD